MVGRRFCQRRQLQLFLCRHAHRVLFRHMELSLGQRTSLIHDYRLRMRERLQIVAALYQDAVFGRTADTAEKAQRHRDDQRTWAGDNEERQTHDRSSRRTPAP